MTYRVCSVSFLNARPFAFGLMNSSIREQITFQESIPSECAAQLLSGKADIGLVPVSILPKLKNPIIFSDYCIGADGEVQTVMLYSHVPLNEIKKIYLDFRSNTSVLLVKVLAQEHWKISVEWEQGGTDYEKMILGQSAGLVIGDRAFEMNGSFPFQYDLAKAWKDMTGLPFVFAAWVSNLELSNAFVSDFNRALKKGLSNLDEVCAAEKDPQKTKDYFLKNISFNFDSEKKKGLDLFLKWSTKL